MKLSNSTLRSVVSRLAVSISHVGQSQMSCKHVEKEVNDMTTATVAKKQRWALQIDVIAKD